MIRYCTDTGDPCYISSFFAKSSESFYPNRICRPFHSISTRTAPKLRMFTDSLIHVHCAVVLRLWNTAPVEGTTGLRPDIYALRIGSQYYDCSTQTEESPGRKYTSRQFYLFTVEQY
jgi:hypothetical protein